MIRKIILSFAFVACLGLAASAQDFDQRLLKAYSKAELVELKKNNSSEYELLVYSLDNAMYITNYSDEKGENHAVVEMPIDGKSYLELGYKLNDIENQFYKIKGTKKGLMILSKKALELQMKSIKTSK